MTADDLRKLARECCLAFNQTPIDPSAGCWSVWAGMCGDVPVGAMAFIRDRIVELDALPRNFGRHVKHYGREWTLSRGTGPFVRQPCPDCDKDLPPGFFFAWDRTADGEPHRIVLRCRCSQGRPVDGLGLMTKSQAVREGYAVVPHGFEGGSLVYEMRLRGASPAGGGGAYIAAAKNRNLQQRRAHLEALAEAETWP